MSTPIVIGPLGRLTVSPGLESPWYIIGFDKAGRCTSPETRSSLIEAVKGGGYRRVIVFSHGWNNTFAEVEALNRSLIGAVNGVWPPANVVTPPGDLLVVSIFWPSVALLAEDEQGPRIAGGDDVDDQRALAAIADALPASRAKQLRRLTDKPQLSDAEATELAELLASLLKSKDEIGAQPPSADDLLKIARAVEQPARDHSGKVKNPTSDVWANIGRGPAAANTLGWNWRTPVRVATVYLMKQRAGLVGARGVRELLNNLMDAHEDVQLHLGGHSYGCRVMLAAICAERPLRPFASLLLLQPAVSRYCFAEQVPGTNRAGGFRPALQRVRRPLLVTYSAKDEPLHKWFGLAMFLAKDVGEPDLANALDDTYAALGGYGPAGVEFTRSFVLAPGEPYPLDEASPILAINGSAPLDGAAKAAIDGHGDVTSPYTGWMLYSQLNT